MRLIICAFLVALIGTASSAAADNTLWDWVWIVPSPDPLQGWDTFTGQSNVNFDGQSLNATLKVDGNGVSGDVNLIGRITGRNATVTVIEIGTDAKPETYTGDYIFVRSKPTDPSNGWGSDRVSVRSGSSYLALYRRVHSSN